MNYVRIIRWLIQEYIIDFRLLSSPLNIVLSFLCTWIMIITTSTMMFVAILISRTPPQCNQQTNDTIRIFHFNKINFPYRQTVQYPMNEIPITRRIWPEWFGWWMRLYIYPLLLWIGVIAGALSLKYQFPIYYKFVP